MLEALIVTVFEPGSADAVMVAGADGSAPAPVALASASTVAFSASTAIWGISI